MKMNDLVYVNLHQLLQIVASLEWYQVNKFG